MRLFFQVLGISLIVTLFMVALPFAVMAISALLTFGSVVAVVYVVFKIFGPETSEDLDQTRGRKPNHYDPSKDHDSRPH